ncbi:hypothetical protein FRC08_000038 [Ceratobasidium sp. 394]|nr:hypothetical protein FRC08_000038 [Ceratobasidium sp. 394]
MCTLTLNFDPLDCTCWLLPDGEYCAYCEVVCDAALQDYQRSVRDWLILGTQSGFDLAQEADHQAVLAKFFEEGQAPTPPPVNYTEDLGEELLSSRSQWSGEKKGKGKENWHPHVLAWGRRSARKPYTRVDGKRKEDLTSYLVLLQ